MRAFTSIVLLVLLLMLHTSNETSRIQTVHTYVPPLTHTPGLGLSMIGSHSDPPLMLFESMHGHTSNQLSHAVSNLFQKHKAHLDTGVQLRLQMQQQTQMLLKHLPSEFAHKAWKERLQHEERIGELRVWSELLNRTE